MDRRLPFVAAMAGRHSVMMRARRHRLCGHGGQCRAERKETNQQEKQASHDRPGLLRPDAAWQGAPARRQGAMHSLPVFLRLEGRPVILLGAGDAAEAKRRLLERGGATIVGEAGDARLAIVAIEEEALAEAAVARLRARGILVNAVDRPALCDFTLPAIVDRDPVLVAIGTGGASAGLAKALRQRIEALLPAGLGTLADRLHAARDRIRTRFPDAAARRRAIDAALDPGGPLDPLARHDVDIDDWLAAAHEHRPQIIRIRLRSADPDDLTIREARALAQADTVHLLGDVPAAIRHRIRADARQLHGSPPPEPIAGLTVILAATV